jgi:hypothetical protein
MRKQRKRKERSKNQAAFMIGWIAGNAHFGGSAQMTFALMMIDARLVDPGNWNDISELV